MVQSSVISGVSENLCSVVLFIGRIPIVGAKMGPTTISFGVLNTN